MQFKQFEEVDYIRLDITLDGFCWKLIYKQKKCTAKYRKQFGLETHLTLI